MRKVACLAVFMALMMLVPVQAGGDVSMQQTKQKRKIVNQVKKQNDVHVLERFEHKSMDSFPDNDNIQP